MTFPAKAGAFAPANISLIFTIEEHPDPAKMGSRGVGFTVDGGMTATVFSAGKKKSQIYFNGKRINFPTVEAVLAQLTLKPVRVRLSSPLPLGCGFGLSGASALATAYAVNALLNLSRSEEELAKIAHFCEVTNHTGLGDVVNQHHGGFCIKQKVSSSFEVKRLPFEGEVVYYQIFSPLETKAVLTNKLRRRQINKAGNWALAQIDRVLGKGRDRSFGEILDIAYRYVVKSGLLTDRRTKQAIGEVRRAGGHASMIILGNGVVADRLFPGGEQLTISRECAHTLPKLEAKSYVYTTPL